MQENPLSISVKSSQQTGTRKEFQQHDKKHLPKNLKLTPYLMVKDFMLSPKIRNKTGYSISFLFNIILVGLGQCNKARK